MTAYFYGEPIFTDAVKDVIGNEPVLDQFDISYDASFYGGSTDDFVTGTMLSEISHFFGRKAGLLSGEGVRVYTTGTRGRYFSKFYADSAAPLESGYGTDAVTRNPNLSFRLVPPGTRAAKRGNRFVQHYDAEERYYDTCLPIFNECLAANGSVVWAAKEDNPNALGLSPYRNVVTGTVGHVLFNFPYFPIGSPLVDNKWTWSYPYEARYNPNSRVISTTNAGGINLAQYESNYTFTSFNRLKTQRKLKGLMPLLPGVLPPDMRFRGGRPAYRIIGLTSGTNLPLFPFSPSGSGGDSLFGYEWLIPSDVRLDTKVSHNYLGSFPVTKPIDALFTGTMTYNDTVKTLFGFGDLNNMQYGYTRLDANATTSSIVQFGDEKNPTSEFYPKPVRHAGVAITAPTTPTSPPYTTTPNPLVKDQGGYIGDLVKLDWSVSPNTGSAEKGWAIKYKSGSIDWPPGSGILWNYIGEIFQATAPTNTTSGTPELPKSGIYWLSSSTPGVRNECVLMSDTDYRLTLIPDTIPGGPKEMGHMYDWALPFDVSIAAVDITSSIPWTLRYKRAVCSHVTDGLLTYFSAIPGYPAHPGPAGYGVVVPLEYVQGDITIDGGSGSYVMQQFDLRSEGSTDPYPTNAVPVTGSFEPYKLPLLPGDYRLCFAYIKTGSYFSPAPANVDRYSSPSDFAAIDDLEIVYWPTGSFSYADDLPKIGGNNYPVFRSAVGDARYQPLPTLDVYPNNEPSVVSSSSAVYQSFNFGVSPIIRGWKYGLYSGLPQNSKAVFRREHYGQFRDMLEQRHYAKFVNVKSSPVDGEAIVVDSVSKELGGPLPPRRVDQIGPPVVSVNFVSQSYKIDGRGIGDIINTRVAPELTNSQNMSAEVTSSLPYFDGESRSRP